MKLSIIVPVLNEESEIEQSLLALQSLREQGHQLIVVDGGSSDSTSALAQGFCDDLISSEPGRAVQMNTGAKWAKADVLLFLHADNVLPEAAEALLQQAFADPAVKWGRFDVQMTGSRLLRLIAQGMNWRSRLTGVATGDQAIFVRQSVFLETGGYSEIPLMEDVEFSKRLRRLAWPKRISAPVMVSARRWKANGFLKTILLMWWLRLLFFVGIPPRRLVSLYYKNSR